MSFAQVYDPETVWFPLDEPKLRLSVSTEEYKPTAGLKVPFDMYAERFDLSRLLEGGIGPETYSPQVGLYVSQLNLVGALPLGVAISGVNGSDSRMDGYDGGSLSVFCDELLPEVAKHITFQARGGDGFSPPNQVGVPGRNAGNGGKGGQVTVLFNTLFSPAAETALDIYFNTRDPNKKWPGDFKDDAVRFVALLDNPAVIVSGFLVTLPDLMKTVEGFLESDLSEVRYQTSHLGNLLGQDSYAIQGDVVQRTDVEGGDRGLGSTGEGVTGKDGQTGQYGERQAVFLQARELVLQGEVCFAHPMQCQMLLDKANFLTFTGTLEDKASAVILLDRLTRRLEVFAHEPPAPYPPLWAAYRSNASRLYTIESGSSAAEPYAIQRLRAIRRSAEVMKQQILSGKDFIGKGRDEVPRGSFTFYQNTTQSLLNTLRDFEETYFDYLKASTDAAAKLANVQMRSEVLAYTTNQNDQLIDEGKLDLGQTTRTIGYAVDSIARAKKELLDSMLHLDDFVQKQFGVTFQDFVSAFTCVLFTNGSKPMIGLQTLGLFDMGTEKVLTDDGVAINKSYLLQKLHDIEGGIKDLTEGYIVLRDGHIDLDDPGAEKILVAEQMWDSLVSEFRNAMDAEDYKEVKKNFQTFYDTVQERNSAVLHYNAILTLLVQFYEKREQLRLDRLDVIRDEYNSLDAGHPAMTSFLKKTYDHSIYTAQVWLYKQQQALAFLSLSQDNIIGDTLSGLPSSALDHGLLQQIQGTLQIRRQEYLEAVGQPPQEMRNVRVYLDEDTIEFIQFTLPTEDLSLRNVEVKTDNPIFHDMYDVRLSAVRFYLELKKDDSPAETKATFSQPLILQAKISHTGTETLLDSFEVPVKFTHNPLKVLFKYIMPEKDGDSGTILTDGTISSENDDIYARVGPFTKWSVDVLRVDNPNLDCTKVEKAYLEFDFQYRASHLLVKGHSA
ncbi:hypothetical protein BO79DRAFT_195509 [Aspergillus costaricaensis CBS 115574]|uniref:Uncharacterized protein n=1 Tax=Aspergillus costaricaensis CBS 115574 TaxID=1448317 RepID=A0ACD1ICJ7_9EURO|nr:hypothetical protein BO79DRAFT_195509 [Aspergillus costaricaensis CBS 115574]RAK88288.1 hypothetical protein BO79DRAFT_195509 [Aspergillus costaricaensis CBS 115574]